MKVRKLAVLGLVAAAGAIAHAEQPYVESIPVNPDRANSARVIVHARLHPEVAVSRSLAAQPTHPYMLEMQIGSLTTWIDPLHDLDGEGGLPEGHSILRAQQLFRDTAGLSAVEVQSMYSVNGATTLPVATNTARVIMPRGTEPLPEPRAVIELRPRSAPAIDRKPVAPVIPSVPKAQPAPDRRMAHLD
jgi:hypothetical protein